MKRWLERHPIFAFFVLAYIYSWTIAVPLALQAQKIIPSGLPLALHYLTAFGPALSAFTISALLQSRVTRARDARSMRNIRTSVVWLIVGFTSPLLLLVIAKTAGRAIGQSTPNWTALGDVNFLPPLGLGAWFLWFVTNGLGEEYGWRGFALPRLQQNHPALTSSVLLSIGWAGWHLPAFFYLPTYAAMGAGVIPGFFIGILSGAIVLTWLYNSSGGSVMAAVLWHASFNFVTASPTTRGLAVAVTSTLVIVWAIVLVWRCPKTLITRAVVAAKHERKCVLPGDDLIPHAFGSLTHAITIRSSRSEVWKWLVQMGAGRAGWYSYDFIDNGRRQSARTIRPELQTIAVGQIMPALPGEKNGFVVVDYEAECFLIIAWQLRSGEYQMTWAFVLEEQGPNSTRLIVRARGGRCRRFYGLPWWIASLVLPAVHFVMQRKQLVGIAKRAETHVHNMA